MSNAKIDAICHSEDSPNFSNTILAFETSHEELERIVGVYWHLFAAHSEGDFKKLAEEISPLLSAHTNDYMLNAKLFSRIESVYKNDDNIEYDEHDTKLMEDIYKTFIRNGASLSDKDKENLRGLDKELSMLSPKFSNNVLDAQNAFELWVTDESELDGLPEDAVSAASQAAKAKNKEGEWLFTLQMASYIPFMTYSNKRHLRETLFKATVIESVQVGDGCAQNSLGDINGDSLINILDVIIVVNVVLGINPDDNCELELSDLNGDGILNILDIVIVVNIVLGN